MAQFAIKGHETRGNEVIEILEMLGGKNNDCTGNNTDAVYSIPNNGYIYLFQRAHEISPDDFIVFTLEEFLEKYPYKVGDKVSYKLDNTTYYISKIHWEHNKVLYDLNDYYDRYGISHSLMFGVEAEELQPYKEETMGKGIIYDEIDFNRCPCADKVQLILGDDFEIKVEGGKTFVVRKKPQYPKSYEECCKIMGVNSDSYLSIRNLYYDDGEEDTTGYEQECLDIFDSLWELKICRDAYWKIAGEQMGLGKPWEPDWNNISDKYCVYFVSGDIWSKECQTRQCPFAFPTEEMRDAFYENFKDFIEECKEFL